MSPNGHTRVSSMIQSYREMFRIKLGADLPTAVLLITLARVYDVRLYWPPQRWYNPLQRKSIIHTKREIEKVSAIYKNTSSGWVNHAFTITKPDRINPVHSGLTSSILAHCSHPIIESQIQHIDGSPCFHRIDLAHSYWQVTLSKESREMMSIQTHLVCLFLSSLSTRRRRLVESLSGRSIW